MKPNESGWTKKYVTLGRYRMAYNEFGTGDPIVFLHGNPVSSYLWRNIAPGLSRLGRCIVPDLIGMGDSDKLRDTGPQSYRFDEQRGFLDEFLAKLGVDDRVVLVLHDWGSALGFHWAARQQHALQGIVYMEAIVCPMRMDEWPARKIFEAIRGPDGEEIILEKNVFIESILPRSIIRSLSAEEMDEYRRPFRTPGEGRRPTLTWPREMPLDGEPRDVVEIVADYANWLASSTVPKLFINAEPGAILTGRMREFCRTFPNQQETTVRGIHFIQEDSPQEITAALQDWIGELRGLPAATPVKS
ncbi:haloalkane dehalogenase [Mycobacterium marseillense]|uniref:haloalkane dehalogenase n=1 Tax=Mycobacterium marseillense TaxID=701042 RepID=UPI00259605B4|nr:haloalkane dehalogenase [Mycobacterium marseillense]MDM3975302.1 haloalkane dehalogenase [Mycobacterium marseillense]